MSWFEISQDAIGAPYVSVGYVNEEPPKYPLLSKSLSDFDFEVYAWLLVGFVILGTVLLLIFKRLGNGVKGSSRVVFVLCAVALMYGAFLLVLLWNVPIGGIPDRLREGAFGDTFGTLNALFSGLAFSGVLITLLMQRIDLSDSRALNRKQQAESQFYNILNLQQQVIQGFDIHLESGRAVPKTVQGRDCFRHWVKKIKRRYDFHKEKGKDFESAQAAAYESVLKAHLGDLGLYFRSLYAVFRFIETADEEDRKHFALVVRSLLSDYELVMLFYNCINEKGWKFKVYAEKYALFDNLDIGLLLSIDDVALMTIEALGENEEALNIKSILSR